MGLDNSLGQPRPLRLVTSASWHPAQVAHGLPHQLCILATPAPAPGPAGLRASSQPRPTPRSRPLRRDSGRLSSTGPGAPVPTFSRHDGRSRATTTHTGPPGSPTTPRSPGLVPPPRPLLSGKGRPSPRHGHGLPRQSLPEQTRLHTPWPPRRARVSVECVSSGRALRPRSPHAPPVPRLELPCRGTRTRGPQAAQLSASTWGWANHGLSTQAPSRCPGALLGTASQGHLVLPHRWLHMAGQSELPLGLCTGTLGWLCPRRAGQG